LIEHNRVMDIIVLNKYAKPLGQHCTQ